MSKLFFSSLFLFVIHSTLSQKNVNDKAVNYYQRQLLFVKQFYEGNSKKSIDNAINVLEKISKIKSYEEHTFEQKPIKIPLEHNIEDWEEWLRLNKQNLSFDEEKQELVLLRKQSNVLIVKQPIDVFLKYINDLKTMKNKGEYHINEIDYRLSILESLTAYKEIDFNTDCDCFFPKEKDFKKYLEWLQVNKNSLVWNKEKQILEIHAK